MRQFLTESLLLAMLGGGIGLSMSGWLSGRLFTLFVNGRDLQLSVAPDWRVLAFTAAVSIGCCLIAGLAPALQTRRTALNPSLKE